MIRTLSLLLAVGPLFAQPLYPWLESIARRQLAARSEVISRLKTPESLRERGKLVRANLIRWMGGLPTERTPLRLQRTGVIEHDDYRVEKIVFESQPRFFVTANLYTPKTGTGPYPAVVQPTGHSVTAKARQLYQSLSIGLVKYGFVVLTYDPLGQGERRIFFDPDLQDSKVGGTTVEHQMVGVQSLLGGESLARQMVWDGIRAIDLVASLPQVDANRIGVAGCSGGGTLTAYIAAVDDRVRAAAPACYITSWEEQLKVTGPQDAEQQFPDQLREGFDHADFLIAAAPKPYLICSTTEDFFPIAGARQTYLEAKEHYNRFGAEDRIAWFTAPGGHGMGADTRGAIYGWMRKWLQSTAGPAPEPAFQVELEEDLNVTATGQVATSLGGETASTQNMRRFAAIQPYTADLAAAVRTITRYQPVAMPIAVATAAQSTDNGARIEQLTFEPHPGRRVPATLYYPPQATGETLIVADTAGKATESAKQLMRAGHTILALDIAGTGDTADQRPSYSNAWFPQDKSIWLALMVGHTFTGLRMADIIGAVELLSARQLAPQGVTLFARGNPGVAALHAAVIEPRLRKLVLEDLPPTYRTLATTPIHRQIFDVVVPGVLRHYDLPDLAAAIAPRTVILGRSQPHSTSEFQAANTRTIRRRELTPIHDAYFLP